MNFQNILIYLALSTLTAGCKSEIKVVLNTTSSTSAQSGSSEYLKITAYFSQENFPKCDSSSENTVVLSKSDGALLKCDGSSWVVLELNNPTTSSSAISSETFTALQGDVGGVGDNGSAGASGGRGSNAAPRAAKGSNFDTNSSSGLLEIGSSDYFVASGSADFTEINGGGSGGKIVTIRFDSDLIVKHDSSKLILSGGGDFYASPNSILTFVSESSSVWREIRRVASNDSYVRAALESTSTASSMGTGTLNLVFDQEISDTQRQYNPTTGVITVSQAGIYDIYLHLNSTSVAWGSGNSFGSSILKNGSVVSTSRQTAWAAITAKITADSRFQGTLAVGDQITFQITSNKAAPLSAETNNPNAFFTLKRMNPR